MILAHYHVITQVVKAKLIVSTIGYICSISGLAVGIIHIMHNQANGQAQGLVNAAHIHAIAASQIIVDGNNVYALAGQGIQIYGQGSNQGFTFASTHLRDFATVQHHAANQLYIKMAHSGHTLRSLAHYGKGLG